MRPAKDSDFFVELPEVGTFRFGRRTFGDRIKIRAEYLSLVGDAGDGDIDLSVNAAIVAAFRILCVDAPAGWADLGAVDLLSIPNGEDKIFELYSLLKAKEDSFRVGADQNSKETGA